MTTPPVILDPPDRPYGTIVGRIFDVLADGNDPDPLPDLSILAGTKVELRPEITTAVWTGEGGPAIYRVRTVAGEIDDQGYLRLVGAAEAGIRILGTDHPDLFPSGWRWGISFPDLPDTPKGFARLAPGATVDMTAAVVASDPAAPRWFEDLIAAASGVPALVGSAEAAAVRAEGARDLTLGYRDTAAGHATTATTQAGLAATARTGAEDALASTLAITPRQIWANGRPDIPATTPYTLTQLNAVPTGHEYVSLDRPQGARRWIKTGASTWQCVEGDTGWIDISGLLEAGLVPHSVVPRHHVRKVVGETQLAIRIEVVEGYSGIGYSRTPERPFLSGIGLPGAFGVADYVPQNIAVFNSNMSGYLSSVGSRQRLSFGGGTGLWAKGDSIFASMNAPCLSSAWPTSLTL